MCFAAMLPQSANEYEPGTNHPIFDQQLDRIKTHRGGWSYFCDSDYQECKEESLEDLEEVN